MKLLITLLINSTVSLAAITSTTPSAFTGTDPTAIGGKFVQRATGPSPYPKALTINGTGAWTSVVTGTASGALILSNTLGVAISSGTAPQTVYVSFDSFTNNAYGVGDKSANIAFTGGIVVNFSITLTVVSRTCPLITSVNTTFLNCSNTSWSVGSYCDLDTCNPITNVRPAGTYAPPSIGNFALDTQFGGFFRRVTGVAARFHPYSSVSPFNSDNSLFLNIDLVGGCYLSNPTTGAIIHSGVQCSGFIWDSDNPNIYYYLSGKTLRKVVLPGLVDTLHWSYSGTATAISNGGTGDTSKDSWIAVYTDIDKMVCAVNSHNTTQAPCSTYDFSPSMGTLDFVIITKGTSVSTGKRYIVAMGSAYNPVWQFSDTDSSLTFIGRMPVQSNAQYYDGAMSTTCTDTDASAVTHHCFISQHADTVEISGEQYLVYPFQDDRPFMQYMAYMKFSSNVDLMGVTTEGGGNMTLSLPISNGTLGTDSGCAKKAPYCLFTRFEDPPVASGGGTATPAPHQMELFIIRGLNIETRRLSKHRSIPYSDSSYGSYYDQPKGALSPDATIGIYDSNYGVLDGGAVYTIATGVSSITGGGVQISGKVANSGKVVNQ